MSCSKSFMFLYIFYLHVKPILTNYYSNCIMHVIVAKYINHASCCFFVLSFFNVRKHVHHRKCNIVSLQSITNGLGWSHVLLKINSIVAYVNHRRCRCSQMFDFNYNLFYSFLPTNWFERWNINFANLSRYIKEMYHHI